MECDTCTERCIIWGMHKKIIVKYSTEHNPMIEYWFKNLTRVENLNHSKYEWRI